MSAPQDQVEGQAEVVETAASNGNSQGSPQSVLTTTIEHVSTTTRSSGSSGSSSHGPMFSTGEQTVIRMQQESGDKSSNNSIENKSANCESPSNDASRAETEATVRDKIPPLLLHMINRAYVGLNFYDQLMEESKNTNYDFMSDMFRQINAEDPDYGEDDEVVIAKLAAKHIQALEDGNREKNELMKQVGRKMGFINEQIEERTEVLKGKLATIKVVSPPKSTPQTDKVDSK